MSIRLITVFTYRPIPGTEGLGGFSWGEDGSNEEQLACKQFDLESDTNHHDYTGTHHLRLVQLPVPTNVVGSEVTDYIDEFLLDAIMSGAFDGSESDRAKHLPEPRIASKG